MITHFHEQAMSDALSGSNTETYSEPAVDISKQRLRIHTELCYGLIVAYKMGFSEDVIGTVEDFKILNFK